MIVPSANETASEASLSTEERHFGPFVTQLIKRGRGTRLLLRTSRRFRRGLSDIPLDRKRRIQQKIGKLSLLFALRPDLLSWWVGTLFMVGSALFVAGSVILLYPQGIVSVQSGNLTYFIGSLFFTSAAYGQLLQSINANIALIPDIRKKRKSWRWWARGVRSPGFLSAATQFIGTLLFNITTFDALYGCHSPASEHLFVWIPDMAGSVLFLVSSFFAWIEIYHDSYIKPFANVTWWVVWLNIVGSVLFQLSALYGYINPMTGKRPDGHLSIVFTLWGAACFYLGAHLSNVELHDVKQKTAAA
jgi:hypothetical protein